MKEIIEHSSFLSEDFNLNNKVGSQWIVIMFAYKLKYSFNICMFNNYTIISIILQSIDDLIIAYLILKYRPFRFKL